jgi:hypothetical protein
MSAEFPPNSHKARTEAKRVERVTSGEVLQRKRGLGRQFKDTFVAGDARGAMHYVVLNVVIPAVKEMLSEAMHAGTDRMIYGDTRPRRGTPPSGYGNLGRVDYSRISQPVSVRPSPQQQQGRPMSRMARTRHDFGEIVIASRQEAEEVLDRMYELLSRYGSVSVADLYEMTGIQSGHTDHKWGWTNLNGSRVRRLGTGNSVLDLPDPQPFS